MEEYSTGSKIPNLSFFQVSNLDSDLSFFLSFSFGVAENAEAGMTVHSQS